MFDQFTRRNPIPEFLWVRMEVERETVNFVLFGLFQFQPPTLPTLSSLHILLESRLVNTAKSVPPRPWAKIRLITFRHQFLKRSPWPQNSRHVRGYEGKIPEIFLRSIFTGRFRQEGGEREKKKSFEPGSGFLDNWNRNGVSRTRPGGAAVPWDEIRAL